MSIEKEVTAFCNMLNCKDWRKFIYNEEESRLNKEELYICQNCGALRVYDSLEIKK